MLYKKASTMTVFSRVVILLCLLLCSTNSAVEIQYKDTSRATMKKFKVCGIVYNDINLMYQHTNDKTRYNESDLSELLETDCGFKNNSLTLDYRWGTVLGKKTLNQHNIETVSMSFSNITEFKNDFFCGFTVLSHLHLRDNKLTDVIDIGLGLSHHCDTNSTCNAVLRDLDLSGNSLRAIKNTSLCLLGDLRVLTVQNCELQSIETGAFDYNNNLEFLSLKDNFLEEIPPIAHLKNLKKLDISYNSLESIRYTDFNQLTHLIDVNLSYNKIISVDVGAFDNLENAEIVNMSHCKIDFVDYLFQKVNVYLVDLSYNRISRIEGKQFSNHIKHLILSHNKIKSLLFTTADFPKYLDASIIDLSYNSLSNIEYLILPLSLKQLDLSNNQMEVFFMHWVAIDRIHIEKLNFPEINLKNNSLQVLPPMMFPDKFNLDENPLVCHCLNSWLFNSAVSINTQFRQSCKSVSHFNPSHIANLTSDMLCESSYYDSNRCIVANTTYNEPFQIISPTETKVYSCQFECPFPCYCYTTEYFEILHLYCSNNHLPYIPELPSDNLLAQNSKVTLWLDGNHFITLNSGNFTFINTVKLYLNNSNIISVNENTFHNMTQLELIDLSKNKLTELPVGIFNQLTVLKTVLLNDNLLKILPNYAFEATKQLQTLHLNNNRLSKFPKDIFKNDYNLNELTMYNNVWQCECDFILNFNEYLKYHSRTVLYPDQTLCVKDDGEFIEALTSTDYYEAHCKIEPINVIKMWIGISFACVSLIIAVLLFIFRYEIQVILYSKLKFRIFKQANAEDIKGKRFDAFVSYSSDDSDFIVNEILPKLEQIDYPYEVCIHERNFMPGDFIQDAILEAVKQSSRTIIVLTENFVNSGWCMYEFKVAHMQMMEDRCPRIILIVKDDIPKDLNTRLKMYIKTNTYLKWGERLFWQKLYYTMPSERVDQISAVGSSEMTITRL
ncbi:TOLL-like receptor [Chamberlinius hualienensis]